MISSGTARRIAWMSRASSYSGREGVMLRAASGSISSEPTIPNAMLSTAMANVVAAA